MVIAFDYDGCADDLRIQGLIGKLIKEKNEVWIVTMRRENEFNEKVLKPILSKIGLCKYNVIYSNNKPKLEMLEMINADIYIDNNNFEFENIANYTTVVPLLFTV